MPPVVDSDVVGVETRWEEFVSLDSKSSSFFVNEEKESVISKFITLSSGVYRGSKVQAGKT